MKDIAWDMNDQTIVRRIAKNPEQQTLPDPTLERVKQGERMRFDAHVNVETLPEGMHLKKVTIFSNVPNGGTWELISDEGTAVGGGARHGAVAADVFCRRSGPLPDEPCGDAGQIPAF